MVSAWFLPLLFAMVLVSTYSFSDGVKYSADKWFDLRRFLKGGPSAGLPYTLALVLLVGVPIVVAAVQATAVTWYEGVVVMAWSLAYFWFHWGLCWLASGMSKSILNAKRAATAFLVAVNVMINVFFGFGTIMVSASMGASAAPTIPDYNPFVPVGPTMFFQLGKAVVLVLIGVGVWKLAEGMRRKKALALELV